ncbi:peptidylprolyl isomerase [Mucilaginibacter sp. JRF]|uniref:peptidylprolyl isomerase n=1 Tax=Mucilaginibacter sp. JRF TaxID=2780088 RepID=UPI001D16D1F9|nr:peptidylprolyl isomerase [Mucilaginibacter sp. JRF]
MSKLRYIKNIAKAALGLMLMAGTAFAQKKQTLDKVSAVVGNSPILQSDIELQYARYQAEGGVPNPDIKCQIMQTLISQKLLGQQAIIDSVIVKDEEVDNEVDRRMRGMIQRAGGQERLEGFLGRSVLQYKDEIRDDLHEQLVAQRMREKIIEKLNVTPQEVKEFFEKIPKDSLPTINKEVEVGEIVFQPKLTKEEKAAFKQKAEDLRTRVKKGEDFASLARLYSQDGSAAEGGDLGFADRNSYVKEFASYAFKLKAGEISPVFESEYGFHFLQVIERRGEQVHVRHILIIPTTTEASLTRASHMADSIYTVMKKNKAIDFSSAAAYYSDNKDTKYNGGMMLNLEDVQSRSTLIPTDKLDPQVALVIDTMKVGEFSKPQLLTEKDGKKNYKILYLKSVTDAHKASIEKDFPKLKEQAYNTKMNRMISEWFERKRKETYIRIDEQSAACPQLQGWASTTTTAQAN